ncbi:uncharacterized protein NFIA_075330 [Aspergillus fischeri NRRL 181]|uniref:Uncharacterized protein n=1 Tax=Neosartorya fischeri (strain ATCC 1020 / DSM 3700 / CBS 544.65 / FGSC A1164 / JCM 1740 / NRRL 181 / WB 181) TaxID=331117 RepID=A1DDZ7_NEOFI|nr:conserved hypothetical protein [Aspergillus fischeri NRRL 181]EAW17604.1 conserved hypothetical protein [Aspergillus fischeri NRRL 181]
MSPSDMTSTGDASSRRANKSRDLDPLYDPDQDDQDPDEDDQFSLRIPKDGRRKRALDPTYIPGKNDTGEDDDDEQIPTGLQRKKRRTLDPAFVPDKDDGDQDIFLDSSKRGKGRTTDKRTSKRKATSDIGAGNLPTPSKETPRPAKMMKTEPTSPRVQVPPALTVPQPDTSDGETVTKNPWELVNARTQPNHPLVVKAMKVLNKIADDRNRAFFALVKAHQRSRKSYPARVAGNTNDEAHTQGNVDSSRKRNKTSDAVARHSNYATQVDDTRLIQEDEADNSAPDLSLERAKRWANAVNVPKGLWSEVEKQLFYRIAMRGFEPLLPKQWHYDFSTLPNPLFAVSGEKPAPLINAIGGSEFYGFVISGPVVAILTRNTDPSAANGQRGTEDSHFICQLDLSERGQDVWNSLAVAISVMHIRNTMMKLAEHDLAGLCRFNADAHVVVDQDL